jgi:hypothetical protein
LPPLEEPHPIAPDLRERFQRDGHIDIRGLLSEAEVAAYRAPIADAVTRVYGPLTQRERTLFMGDCLWTRDPIARQFVLARRFARVAADLLGVDAVRLWRDVAFFKDPQGEVTPWHQDSFWEPLDGHTMLVLWIALSDVTDAMAPLAFVSGSHRNGCAGVVDHNGSSQASFRSSLEARGRRVAGHGPLRAGDATVHTGWTLHSSPMNTSDLRREALSIIYFADGVRIAVPTDRPPSSPEEDAAWREVHAHHMAKRFPGKSVGDLAESAACPLVFQR